MNTEQEPGHAARGASRLRSPSLWLALGAFVAWIFFGFVAPVGAGGIHLLLAMSMALLMRWLVVDAGEW